MSKNDRIEIKVSSQVRAKFEVMVAELTPHLRKKLGRRAVGEDVINVILEAYRKNPLAFTEEAPPRAQFK
jgi:hypothetical protein